jgi:hypothetical protein
LAQPSLLFLVALVVAAAVGYASYVRRRRRIGAPRPRAASPPLPPLPSMPLGTVRRAAGSRVARASGGSDGGLALAAAPSGPVACPACRREFSQGVRFCPYDSRRLVPAGEVVERSRVAGSVCPRCRRAYDAGIRHCSHDAEELMPAPLWEATRARKPDLAPTGVLAKICPQCAGRYDLATTFCGKDGSELMTIN